MKVRFYRTNDVGMELKTLTGALNISRLKPTLTEGIYEKPPLKQDDATYYFLETSPAFNYPLWENNAMAKLLYDTNLITSFIKQVTNKIFTH